MIMNAAEMLAEYAESLPLVDHHVHGALRKAPDRAEFEELLTERAGGNGFDTQLGFAVRRWCAPLLGLEPSADAEAYLAARVALGETEVARRLLAAAGTDTLLIDTGFAAAGLLGIEEMAALTGQRVAEVLRLEALAEDLLAEDPSPSDFLDRFPAALAETDAIAFKSVMAYRSGFDVPAERPSRAALLAALDRYAAAGAGRLTDPVLLRQLQWWAIDAGRPLQLHCGYGDADLDLRLADPLLLTPWLRAVEGSGVPIMLLHNYPYHRQAGYLAEVFGSVYFDVGLAITHSGAASRAVIAESLEVAPFGKQLYSSDAFGLPELHLLGARLWRRGMAAVLAGFVDAGEWELADARRVLALIGRENAVAVYGL